MNPYVFATTGWFARDDGGERRHFGMRCSADLEPVADGVRATVYHVGRGGALNRWRTRRFSERLEAQAWAAAEAIRIATDPANWCGETPEAIDAEYWAVVTD